MKEIPISAIRNIKIGQVENPAGGTGCTVLLCEQGMTPGIDIRGGGPAVRDTELCTPLASMQTLHAAVLAGGSAFGLEAATGVQEFLEEKGVGYNVGVTIVPIVSQIDLFDLAVGDPRCRPDKAMGRAAAEAAYKGGNYRDGNYGAGCGATVGKAHGITRAMKSGIGSYAVQLGELQIGAVVAVNALGDIIDHHTGKKIAGLLNATRDGFVSTEEDLCAVSEVGKNFFTANTTIGAILTNARFDKAQLCKIAGMAQDGMARSIRPVHSTADGDALFALSVGEVDANQDLVGMLAANVLSEAIVRGVKAAEPVHGLPAARDLADI